MSSSARVTVGRITGVYGVKGWVKVRSYTEPVENIVQYQPWHIVQGKQKIEIKVDAAKHHGVGLVAHIIGCDDREKAKLFSGAEIEVDKQLLPAPTEGEYYWHQLTGLDVVTDTGIQLGKVDHLIETGSNDVLVVVGERERLIPYLPEKVIKMIDLKQQVITVDWDPEF